MELIKNIIIEYLKHNKRLVVPKLGAFIVKQPSGIVRFSELMRTDDGVLRSLLMAYGASSIEANGRIDRFVFEIRHAITVGQEYTIDGFGTFRRGENNNIIFRCEQEPLKVGGSIKPPVEALVLAQQRLRRSGVRPVRISSTPSDSKPPQSKRPVIEPVTTELSLSKPDNYLRGLNYEKTKGRKHSDESRNGSSHRRGKRALPTIIITLLLAATIVGAWLLWQHFSTLPEDSVMLIPHSAENSVVVPDSLIIDSIHIERDTLFVEANNNVIE